MYLKMAINCVCMIVDFVLMHVLQLPANSMGFIDQQKQCKIIYLKILVINVNVQYLDDNDDDDDNKDEKDDEDDEGEEVELLLVVYIMSQFII